MVSLEDKCSYSNRINDSPKLLAFNKFLEGKGIKIPYGEDLSETDRVFYGIIIAIQSNKKAEFKKYYNKKSKSNPSKETPAPFVNDDFLIFSIILGVTKFEIDKHWIKNIVSIRSKNAITTTFENLLQENYFSTSNIPEIVFVFLQQTYQSMISNEYLNTTFNSINQNRRLFSNRSDFLILCAIHAYDSIIVLKEAPEGSEIQLLKSFEERFYKRAKVLSWIFQVFILCGFIYGLLKLPIYSPKTVEIINEYNFAFTILGALGFTFLGNQLGYFKRKSHEFTMRILGYPQHLINNFKNKSLKINDNAEQ